MKKKIISKINNENGDMEISFYPEGWDLSIIENLFADDCSTEDFIAGEQKVLEMAEQIAKGRGYIEETLNRAVLISYKMVCQ